jgi:hypothetical protein
MNQKFRTIALVAGVFVLPAAVHAQFDFTVDGRQVQVHSFVSEGFGYSNDNNYLTMNTGKGSFAMTDGGVNISTQLTDKLRVGAQVYDRNVGQLGDWHPELDWAFADYRFASWFGVRGGKVKTTLGLYNDTQDQDFLRVFALLPQSIYPTDLRDSTIAHTGGDIYGTIGIKKLGSLSYTVFAGERKDSSHGGYVFMLQAAGIDYTSYGGLQYGADLRWMTPLKGLLVGASSMRGDITGTGTWTYSNAYFGGTGYSTIPTKETTKADVTNQFYGQYTFGNLTLETEYRRYWRDHEIFNGMSEVTTDVRGWYAAASYRISKRVSAGTYYSRFTDVSGVPGTPYVTDTNLPDHHLFDKVCTLRYDLTNNWNVKVEGHFMNGYGSPGMYPDGFYTEDNPQGLKPKTNLLIVRTGWNF